MLRLRHVLLLWVVVPVAMPVLLSGCFHRTGSAPSSSQPPGANGVAGVDPGGGIPGTDRAASPDLLHALAAATGTAPDGGIHVAEIDDGFGTDDDEPGAELEEGEPSPLTEEEEEAAAVEEEGESHDLAEAPEREGIRYTADLSDEQLLELWKSSPEKLGAISIGFVDEGRMVNAERFPDGDGWVVVSPDKAYATQETISYLVTAAREVKSQFPNTAPLRVNQLSSREGGYLRPHKSHQNGRDVDLGFYYRNDKMVRVRARERYIDPARNWALVKALVTLTDVQLILVDRRVQKVLYTYALKSGENKAWLDSLFKRGKKSIIRHARRHRDHFHVRFYNARAQELGRRVAPLLALRPEHNIKTHRVRRGDTLGAIARRYGTTVRAIRKANGLKSGLLKQSQVLKVPLRGPCTRCPIPPAQVLPERLLPPGMPRPASLPLLATPSPVERSPASAELGTSGGESAAAGLLVAPASGSASSASGLVAPATLEAAAGQGLSGTATVPASAVVGRKSKAQGASATADVEAGAGPTPAPPAGGHELGFESAPSKGPQNAPRRVTHGLPR